MSFRNLAACVRDLEKNGLLVRIPHLCVDPFLELASIQRRAYRKGAPALLFPRVKGSPFPVLANLFGTRERIRHIFRHTLGRVEALLRLKADPHDLFRHPGRYVGVPLALANMLPRKVKRGPSLAGKTRLGELPQLVSWPKDGGAYITLPQVYTEHPARPGFFQSNLGMYRVQMSGNDFVRGEEVGLHYQIHRGIGPHHMDALARGRDLKVNIFVGGPPALTVAAVMPLPEGVPELCFAGALAGHRIPMIMTENGGLPVPAEADFCIRGYLPGKNGVAPTKAEGPFGDHLGYYSLTHDFPLLKIESVHHRPDAIWPFTSVGRPPQEDTVFGEFIHELTAGLVPKVFFGLHEIHAVDAAGVHPLLLALGSERYVPFAGARMPQELLTCGMSLLGSTQTSLTKYLLIAAREDSGCPSVRHIPDFFSHMLCRTDFSRDLHFITRTTMDTLDYSGISLNQGSKLLWAAAGSPIRRLREEVPACLTLPAGFFHLRLFAPGILVCRGPKHVLPRDASDPAMSAFAVHISHVLCSDSRRYPADREKPPKESALLIVADDADFTCANWDNFLWVVFTRSDPATDIYGANERIHCKHWGCRAPLIIDARMKSFHAPPLEEDPETERRIDTWTARGGPLHGLV
ncbi:MAG: UbiD family decarboxylase [Desulfovibrio sp.]|jgi:4-hydroxy-3-polyprenylbenzoate decarboxylase|nr:UbiD family decarboxylase [Desulfovibrio sp.]